MFTPVDAPRLVGTSHAELVKLPKDSKNYEETVRERCTAQGEDVAKVMISVKNSFEPGLLDVWCDLKLKKNKNSVTDDRLMQEIQAIVSTVKNGSIHNIPEFFKQELRLDLKQSDVNERIMQYVRRFRQLVEEEGLEGCFEGKEGAKERCKLIVSSIEPTALRDNIKLAIKYQNRKAGENEQELFDLVIKLALEQEREFRSRKNAKNSNQLPQQNHEQRRRSVKTKQRRQVSNEDNASRPEKFRRAKDPWVKGSKPT
ncbi:hypothetical protein PHMEG_00039026, partial [Phytophthora megakarya]